MDSFEPQDLLGQQKKKINVATLGCVDSGKSTIFGRLLVEMNAISPKFWKDTREMAIDYGKESFQYAYIFARNNYERDRCLTMNFSVKYLVTELSNFTLIDLPGHRPFIKNTIRGLSQADSVIVVVSAGIEFERNFSIDGIKEYVVLALTRGAR